MNTCLNYLILLTLTAWSAGAVDSISQPATSSEPVARTERAATGSEELKASKLPTSPALHGTNFEERLTEIIRKANSQPGNHDLPEKKFDTNYQIHVEHVTNGKRASFSIVTAEAKFTYNGITKETVIDGTEVPATITFEAELSKETDNSIFLGYFLGRTVPYSSASYGGKGAVGYTSIQQLQVGTKNGATFQFGKPLKVVESAEETITITISKVKSQ